MKLSYEGDGEQARLHLGKVQQELDRLQARLDSTGLDRGSFQLVLTDTAYAFGYILPGGLRAAHIVATPGVEEPISITEEPVTPDFISGYTVNAHLTGPDGLEKIDSIMPTAESALLHEKELGGATRQPSQRLGVRLDSAFDEMVRDPGYLMAQHHYLRPTMYSGTMQKVVQFLLGFGKQPFDESIYDKVDPSLDPVDEDDALPKTKYQEDVAKNGLQIRFDCRYLRTHGIAFSGNGTPWLIEIGYTRGICAMPLPLHDLTTTDDFREKVENVGDDSAREVLDLFGGFPSGEAFPRTKTGFDAYVRAGRILQLVSQPDMYEFYRHAGYSSVMGWSFSDTGHEAHNTGYRWEESDGIQRGVHYSVALSVPNPTVVTPDPAADSLKGAVLETGLGEREEVEAILWKIDRMSKQQVDSWLTLFYALPADRFFAEINDYVGTPIGAATARLSKVSEGKIYWPSKYQPQIKFPEPILGYLLSHDMRADRPLYIDLPKQDTTMHVFFVGQQLKWCKFFCDPTTSDTKVEGDDDYEITWCPVGGFTRTTTYGPRGVPAMFYTNDFDDRQELGTIEVYEKWLRKDEGFYAVQFGSIGLLAPGGYDNHGGEPTRIQDEAECGPGSGWPQWADAIPENGANEDSKKQISKWKRFRYEKWTTTTSAMSLGAAIAVPFFQRNAYYYATMKGDNGKSGSYSLSHGAMASPYVGHWSASDTQPGKSSGDRCVPYGANLLWCSVYFTPSGSSPYQTYQGIADDGDWLTMLRDYRTYLTPAVNINLGDYSTFTNDPATRTLEVHLLNNVDGSPFKTYTETRRSEDAVLWESWWFIPSPDPDTGFTAYIQESHNAFGDSKVLLADQTINSPRGVNRLVFNGTMPADISSPTFFGVVN